MKYNLGEFEEIVLLLVAAQHDKAYGLSIANAIEKDLKRSVTLSSVHTALYRLEEKGYVRSLLGDPTAERGGRSKRIFIISESGKKAVIAARSMRMQLWESIPSRVMNWT